MVTEKCEHGVRIPQWALAEGKNTSPYCSGCTGIEGRVGPAKIEKKWERERLLAINEYGDNVPVEDLNQELDWHFQQHPEIVNGAQAYTAAKNVVLQFLMKAEVIRRDRTDDNQDLETINHKPFIDPAIRREVERKTALQGLDYDAFSVKEAINKLPVELQQVAWLTMEGYTHSEVAEIMNLSPRTIDNYWAKAQAEIKRIIRGENNAG